ncbi:hypothetical protein A1D22_09180 [Pasteurellaceae bacterium LFhippo2]|nr:hypothetical protein [Pasteurellaceae bacterium LFhippo2]
MKKQTPAQLAIKTLLRTSRLLARQKATMTAFNTPKDQTIHAKAEQLYYAIASNLTNDFENALKLATPNQKAKVADMMNYYAN